MFNSLDIFNSTGISGTVTPLTLPHIIQELSYYGLISECNDKEVKITRKGKHRLNKTIESNADSIVEVLLELPGYANGSVSIDAKSLHSILFDLSVDQINYAIDFLKKRNSVKVYNAQFNQLYDFNTISLTPLKSQELRQQLQKQQFDKNQLFQKSKPIRRLDPAGSPYRFTSANWENVYTKMTDSNRLYLVLGYQFDSTFYNTDNLKNNIQKMFEDVLKKYNLMNESSIELDFEDLSAGYGGHLFNKIAESIIASDIAVFEISDSNPNVM
ncbi:MAG TPA: hypothetical protein VIY08_03245 [Candidatus Nitrosocosmicus sp.]